MHSRTEIRSLWFLSTTNRIEIESDLQEYSANRNINAAADDDEGDRMGENTPNEHLFFST